MGEGSTVDVTVTAGLYCQIAGVLAGFAFTGLHQYLTRRKGATTGGGRQRQGPIALSLFAALTALTICSIVYAILAGGRANSGPALTGLIAYGPIFGLAVLVMFHALVLMLPTNNPSLDLVTWGARFMVSIVGPTIVMALVSVGAYYVTYVASCTNSCDAWLGLILSTPVGRLGIAMSALIFLGSVIVFRFSSWFPIKRHEFWAMMPACLVLAVSMASALFILVLAALPTGFQPAGKHLALIDVFSFLFIGAFSALTAVTTAEAPGFVHIIKSLWRSGLDRPPQGPGDREAGNDRTGSVDQDRTAAVANG